MAQQTQINGNRYSFTSVAAQVNGNDIAKGVFLSINYNPTQEPGLVQGNMVAPVGRTTGYGQATGSFEMLLSEFDDLASDLTDDGSVPVMSVDFGFAVGYSVNDVDVRLDSLQGCRITGITINPTRGTDAVSVTCTMSIMRVTLNGVDAYGDPA